MSYAVSPHSKKTTWLNTSLYPHTSNFIQIDGYNMHYIDEGQGEVLVFVHGTPTWSFLYRKMIQQFSATHRCIAVDHLGFGLSDKPKDYNYTPEQLSKNLACFIDALQLKDITLVVHDFGGPIGLPYALQQAENIKQIVLFNTWLWETKSDKNAQQVNKILHSRLGNFLYLHTNFSPRVLLKKAFFKRKQLTKEIHQHYHRPFPNKSTRYGLLGIGKSLVGSSDWYGQMWNQIDRIRDKPFLIIWGLKDKFIKEEHLKKWENTLPKRQVVRLNCGHFPQEELPEQVNEALSLFLHEHNAKERCKKN